MIDTHCHLYMEEFFKDVNHVIIQSKNSGIIQCWMPAIDSTYHENMIKLKKNYPEWIELMVGLHPCNIKNDNFEFELEQINLFLDNYPCIGIGEIGIDCHWMNNILLEKQKIVFCEQIKIAKKKELPIIIHSRGAMKEIFSILEKEQNKHLKGIFHCFCGSLSDAERIIRLNFLLGIGGLITFKNERISHFLNKIPLQHIVLESDSPYLAPTPFRGKRNDPSLLINVVEKLSYIYNIPKEMVIQITTNNAKNLIL